MRIQLIVFNLNHLKLLIIPLHLNDNIIEYYITMYKTKTRLFLKRDNL